MYQEFPFKGATVIYTYDGPLERTVIDGETTRKYIFPDLSYEERYKRYAEIRETFAKVAKEAVLSKQVAP